VHVLTIVSLVHIMRKLWRLWAKALGEKASADNKEADRIAIIRTLFVLLTVITEIHIIINVYLNHAF
jgi:hypothetical protein